MHAADESEILAGGQVIEQGQVFRNDPHAALGLERFARVEHVLSQHDDLPLRGRKQAGQHFDGGRFTGAVGSEKAVKRATFDAQFEAIDGAEVAKEPRQLMSFQRQIHSECVT